MNKLLKIIVLALIAVMCATSLVACGDGGESTGNVDPNAQYYEYELNDDEDGIILTKYLGDKKLTEITVPSTIEGKPVTELGKNLYRNTTTVEKVNLPDSVTILGNGVFNGCSKLKTVNTAKIVTFGTSCFENCSKLTAVDFSSATIIGKTAFRYCSGLTTIEFPANSTLKEIQMEAFNGCTKLATVNLSASVKEIGEKAFASCSSLKTINLENVKYIGDTAFSSCGMESVNLQSVVLIGRRAFESCLTLKTVSVGGDVIRFFVNSFNGCRSMQSISFVPTTIDDMWLSVDWSATNPQGTNYTHYLNLTALTKPESNAKTFCDPASDDNRSKKDNYYCKKAFLDNYPSEFFVDKALYHLNEVECYCKVKGLPSWNFTVNGVINNGGELTAKVGDTINFGVRASWTNSDPIENYPATRITAVNGGNLYTKVENSSTCSITFTGKGSVTVNVYSSRNSHTKTYTFTVS